MSTCQKIVESDWESRDLSLLLWQLDKGTRSLWIACSKVVTVSGITSPVVDVHKSTFSYFYENPKIFDLMNAVYKKYVQLWLDNYCDNAAEKQLELLIKALPPKLVHRYGIKTTDAIRSPRGCINLHFRANLWATLSLADRQSADIIWSSLTKERPWDRWWAWLHKVREEGKQGGARWRR